MKMVRVFVADVVSLLRFKMTEAFLVIFQFEYVMSYGWKSGLSKTLWDLLTITADLDPGLLGTSNEEVWPRVSKITNWHEYLNDAQMAMSVPRHLKKWLRKMKARLLVEAFIRSSNAQSPQPSINH